MTIKRYIKIGLLCGMGWIPGYAAAQQAGPITIVETLDIQGAIQSVSAGKFVVKDGQGKTTSVRIQGKNQNSVLLENGQRLRFPAKVEVSGRIAVNEILPGAVVQLQALLNRLGQSMGRLEEMKLITTVEQDQGISEIDKATSAGQFTKCTITGTFVRVINNRVVVKIPGDNGFTRKTTLSFELAAGLKATFSSDNIRQATVGGKVQRLEAVRLNTGDIVAKTVQIEVHKFTSGLQGLDEKLYAKYRHLSDTPKTPRLIRSVHFAFMTDVSDREAQIILHKLETMVTLLSRYFGRAPAGMINGFIVRDLDVWPQGVLKEPQGIEKIRNRAGICFNSSLGNQRRAELYSCDDHGVIQHECTHGYCHLAFGSTGPTWLAEGVAELGQYWKLNEKAVSINSAVVSYLKNASPQKKLLEIAVPGRVPAGNWQDYSWRWALCNLLANNPNYSSRFKPLAIALMEQREGVSFVGVYGATGRELAFEYALFLRCLGNGYRPDLCAWQWNVRSKKIIGPALINKKIKAAYGWQASGLQVEKDVSYDVIAQGKWSVEDGVTEVDGAGNAKGRGRLVAVVFRDFQLSEEIELGNESSFVAPSDGGLFLRCRDGWTELSDNRGELTVYFRRSPPTESK